MVWGDNFAEGDSGVPMPSVAIWNEIEKSKNIKNEVKWVTVNGKELFGKVIGLALSIAENRKNRMSDRVAALDIVRLAVMDYSQFEHTDKKET
jgi:hypothetical protein